jgi:hypothetical protein
MRLPKHARLPAERWPMEEERSFVCVRNDSPDSRTALPIALYESNGLIFELYQGDQPQQPVAIRWERLKTVTVTRDDCAFNVSINQGHKRPQQ